MHQAIRGHRSGIAWSAFGIVLHVVRTDGHSHPGMLREADP